jgi:hypothetical protein
MWKISKTSINPTIGNLFAGYSMYLPYTSANNMVTFFLFYSCNSWFSSLNGWYTLFGASLVTCLVTSIYKVPVSYYLKRRVIKENICLTTLFSPIYFSTAYIALLLEDIPELFIKFYMRACFSSIVEPMQSLFIALTSTILLTPFEMYKTRVICHNIDIKYTSLAFVIKLAMSALNTFLFFFLINIINAYKFGGSSLMGV